MKTFFKNKKWYIYIKFFSSYVPKWNVHQTVGWRLGGNTGWPPPHWPAAHGGGPVRLTAECALCRNHLWKHCPRSTEVLEYDHYSSRRPGTMTLVTSFTFWRNVSSALLFDMSERANIHSFRVHAFTELEPRKTVLYFYYKSKCIHILSLSLSLSLNSPPLSRGSSDRPTWRCSLSVASAGETVSWPRPTRTRSTAPPRPGTREYLQDAGGGTRSRMGEVPHGGGRTRSRMGRWHRMRSQQNWPQCACLKSCWIMHVGSFPFAQSRKWVSFRSLGYYVEWHSDHAGLP